MSAEQAVTEVKYRESDGKPMAESDFHRDLMMRLLNLMRQRYRGQHVYVSANNFLYYKEGDPRVCVSPDLYVVKDCSPEQRRVYKTWVEERVPCFVLETTSNSTRKMDTKVKPEKYAEIGVAEYFMYDPTGDYLTPRIQGQRLTGGEYVRIEPDESGALVSEELGVHMRLDEQGQLVMFDSETGSRLLTDLEAILQKQAQVERNERMLRQGARMLQHQSQPNSKPIWNLKQRCTQT